MSKRLIGLTALSAAMVLAAACAPKSRTLPPEPPSSSDTAGSTGTDPYGPGSGSTAAPGSRADFLQAVPSDRILFGFDSYALDAEARRTLDAQAAWLARNPQVRVTIEGHADERGTREYNLALGDRRATSARDYLQSRGVAATRMQVLSWGKERPAVEGSNENAWAQNRRAVTVVPE